MQQAVPAAAAALDGRRPALAWLVEAAGLAWPVVAFGFGALAIAAVAADHQRLTHLDPAIVPEGWTAATFQAALAYVGLSPAGYAGLLATAKAVTVITFFAVAAVAWRRRKIDAGALTVAYFLVAFAANWEVEPTRMPVWLGPVLKGADLIAWAAFINFFLLFPDNRYRPGWTVWLGIGIPALSLISFLLPLSGPLAIGIWAAILVLAVALQVARYRRHSSPAQRQQMRWLLVGFGGTAALMVATLAAGAIFQPAPPSGGALALELVGQAVGQVGFLPIPLAIAVAVTRHGLWNVDRIVNRTLVYGALTLCLGLIYAAVALVTGSRLSGGVSPWLALLAAILVAAALAPARAGLQQILNRAMYGSREDPYSALSRLGRRLGDSLRPDDVPAVIASTVRDALRSPLVEVRIASDAAYVIRAGDAPTTGHPIVVPLNHLGERVGELRLMPRAGEVRFNEADLSLVRDLSIHAAAAVHDLDLRRQLLASRESLVLAREEERSRMSRILHDDLGATLAAQKLKAGGILAAIRSDPMKARDQIRSLEAELAATIRRLRELAYELRPPALEDLGFREALSDLARSHQRSGLAVEFRAPEEIPALPAAVEISVYRIVEQALANTERHAEARRCEVEIELGADIVVHVNDDGRGLAPGAPIGLGIRSMRERAEELGGTFSIEGGIGCGTRITALIPLESGRGS